MNGKEAKAYAIGMGNLELSANPIPKYIATIKQKIPNIAYPSLSKEISLHLTGDNESNGG